MKGSMVEFKVDGGVAKGYLAGAESEERRPGLIVIHEWWGLNDHIKDIAGRFALEGYIVLAPDLYDGKTTKNAEEAGRLMQGLDQARALEILQAAIGFLKKHEGVDSDHIGVTGFCMGGSFALLLPCYSTEIRAAAPFYGDVPEDAELEKLSAPVLFIGAENDFWITKAKMERLSEALARFGKEGEVKVYAGVGHAFFNDTRADAYDADAAKDAWERVKQFFRQHLG
ncbi:MAG TPA: dienelactone hydrolase family protein [Blastocatellia bacterium]|nr:dienelactone hydrolase family protein [Blastocatellia bacterium]